MDFEIQMKGLDGVIARLQKLEPRQAVKVLRDGVKAGNEVFAAAVREKAPELEADAGGNALPPGLLKADIGAHVSVSSDGRIIGTVGPGKLTKHVARWVETGHERVVRKRKSLLGFKYRKNVTTDRPTPAYPFVRPAFEASAREAVEATEAAILAGLRRNGVLD